MLLIMMLGHCFLFNAILSNSLQKLEDLMQCINYILFFTSLTFKSYRHACRYVPNGCLRINDLYNSAELLYPLFDTLETKFLGYYC